MNTSSRLAWFVGALALIIAVPPANAQENSPFAGPWQWTLVGPNLQPVATTARFTVEGSTLRGTAEARPGDALTVEEGRVDGTSISFQIIRVREGTRIVQTYRGQLDGQKIRGKVEVRRNTNSRTNDWTAERVIEERVDPSAFKGVWKWDLITPNGDAVPMTASLLVKELQVSGLVLMRTNEIPIVSGSIEGNRIRFRIERERDGQKQFTQYDGRFSAGSLRGRMESNLGGELRTRDWEALREPEYATRSANVTGTWKYTFPGHTGQSFEPLLRLKQDGNKVTGTLVFNENEVPISEAHVVGRQISFKVTRERDGQPLSAFYQGSVNEGVIRGTIDADWNGTRRTYPWEAKKQRR